MLLLFIVLQLGRHFEIPDMLEIVFLINAMYLDMMYLLPFVRKKQTNNHL